MTRTVIGECGNCGGDVTVPGLWMGTVPPRPRCDSCGAVVAKPKRTALPMERPPKPALGGVENLRRQLQSRPHPCAEFFDDPRIDTFWSTHAGVPRADA